MLWSIWTNMYSILTQTESISSNVSEGLEEEPSDSMLEVSRDVSLVPCPGNSTSSCFILLITSVNAFKSTESVSYLWYLNSSENRLQNRKIRNSMKHYRVCKILSALSYLKLSNKLIIIMWYELRSNHKNARTAVPWVHAMPGQQPRSQIASLLHVQCHVNKV